MIDPIHITNYELSDEGLEEYILFCIGVAGKPALITAGLLESMLKTAHARKERTPWMHPFRALRKYTPNSLLTLVKDTGFGCFNLKARGFDYIVNCGINLRTCSSEDLERCPGIGQKTARFFILHTRKAAQVACLDTHLLKWLAALGYEGVPKGSPQSKPVYQKWEKVFLEEAAKRKRNPADMDLEVWNMYAGYQEKQAS